MDKLFDSSIKEVTVEECTSENMNQDFKSARSNENFDDFDSF